MNATSDRLSRWTPLMFPPGLVNLVLAGPAFQLLTVLLGLSSKALHRLRRGVPRRLLLCRRDYARDPGVVHGPLATFIPAPAA